MKFIKNKLIPFGSYIAITLWPFVFYKGKLAEKTRNHENIHGKQQKELLVIPFYLIYFIEWIFKGYRNVSFEREAYSNEHNFKYLETRKRFGMWR